MRRRLAFVLVAISFGLVGCFGSSKPADPPQVDTQPAPVVEVKPAPVVEPPPVKLVAVKPVEPPPQVETKPVTKAERAKQIRDEIAALKAKLATLETELASLADIDYSKFAGRFVGPKPGRINDPFTLSVGDKGNFMNRTFKVVSVVDADTVQLSHGLSFRFLVVSVPTTGLVDNAVVTMPGVWEVTGTRKHYGSTLYVVEARWNARVSAANDPAAFTPKKKKTK
jgi:hypothetical protein